MTLPELLRAAYAAVQTGGSPRDFEALAREASRLADMVGWAGGPIDPGGRWLDRLSRLQADIETRQAQTPDDAQTMLHHALTDLGRAIAQHDEQLDPDRAAEDGGEDFG